MSTGKRLAKRSIIGTRVCAKWDDGIFYSGMILAVNTQSDNMKSYHNNEQNINSETKYSVRFDDVINKNLRTIREYNDFEIIGPGFQGIAGCVLQPSQRVYITYNGREVSGYVMSHDPETDDVLVRVCPPGNEVQLEIKKRLEEVRLLESRKSARLMDQDTDFARLADMAGDRKRASSHSIDVPMGQGSRKRRPSMSNDEKDGDCMNECTAALVLMSLSCSPHSPNISGLSWGEQLSPSPSSDICSWRSGGRSPTPSPPLSEGGSNSSYWAHYSTTDEGIVIDEFDDLPKKKKATRVVFRCTWPGCQTMSPHCQTIERHVRQTHLTDKEKELNDHEEEFYYTEIEVSSYPAVVTHNSTSPVAVHPHRDMCRPSYEDPEYIRSKGLVSAVNAVNIPAANTPWNVSYNSQKPIKYGNYSVQTNTMTNKAFSFSANDSTWQPTSLSASAPNKLANGKTPGSPTRKARGDTKKCRKVYGMEHRELWCTQCKWKKACSRFGD